ncbi:MAG TPA: FHA domain-containing protein [Chthoniobacterales bacterium]|nr:FHA domain-containing protein [Chthoniobacterales bacterium]
MPQIRVYLSEDNQALHELGEETVTVGRLADNAIQIEDGSVSSHHAEIVFERGEYHLNDKGSTNGTFVNGEQISNAVLKDSDQIRFGNIDTVFTGDKRSKSSEPLPQSERAVASLASNSNRPATFVNASPFPRPKEKTDGLTMAAIALAVLGGVAFIGAIALSVMIQAPA